VQRCIEFAVGSLTVRFRRAGDRVMHEVIRRLDPTGAPMLSSLEGDSGDDWPPSPPLQQMDLIERQGPSRVLALVGMAGVSHWSLSVTSDEHQARVTFDVACRIRDERPSLASSYRLGAGASVLRHERQLMVIRQGEAELRVALDSDFAEQGIIELAGDRLAIRPAQLPTATPATSRWRYTVTDRT